MKNTIPRGDGKQRIMENTRLIWAITAKDILAALKNKNTISVIISALFVVIAYRVLPTLTNLDSSPNVLIYDGDESALVAFMQNSDVLEVHTFPTEEKMKGALSNADVPELGLVLPAGLDQALEAGQAPELQGYLMYWVDEADAIELKNRVKAEITRLVGTPVDIQVTGNVVYNSTDSSGLGNWAALATVFVVATIGLSMIPHLMLEEKQSHTMEALLVSPANAYHVVAAKALVGLFYCLLIASIALGLNHNLVLHWELAIAAVVLGSLFTTSLGILLGTLIENRGQLTLGASILIAPLFFPIILSLMDDLFPAVLIQVFRGVPTTVQFNLLRASFAGSFPLGKTLLQLVWLVVCAAPGLLATAWLVHRQDRGVPVLSSLRQRYFPKSAPIKDLLAPISAILSRIRQPQESSKASLQEIATTQVQIPAAKSGFAGSLRVVWAIIAKDFLEAVQNKIVLSIIIGTSFMVASSAVIPLILRSRDIPSAVVYDQGRSTIVRALTGRDDFRIRIVTKQEEMEELITQSPEVIIGLVLPADFDQRAGSSEVISLEGYTNHWADPEKITQRLAFFEEQLGLAIWGSVQIDVDGRVLYPSVGPKGQPYVFLLLLSITILTIGVTIVSVSFVEEKEAHTFQALLVSPAGFGQIVTAKALVGIIFCFIASGVVILANAYMVVHWEIALLGILLGAILAAGIGLLMGGISDNPSTTGMWAALLIIALLFLTFMQEFSRDSWPHLVRLALSWVPGPALIKLLGAAMAWEIPAGLLWTNAIALLSACVLVYGLVFWRIRQFDR